MVTTSKEPPPLGQVYCVHVSYAKRLAPVGLEHWVWNDKNLGGVDGSFWRCPGTNLLVVRGGGGGHSCPTGLPYGLLSVDEQPVDASDPIEFYTGGE